MLGPGPPPGWAAVTGHQSLLAGAAEVPEHPAGRALASWCSMPWGWGLCAAWSVEQAVGRKVPWGYLSWCPGPEMGAMGECRCWAGVSSGETSSECTGPCQGRRESAASQLCSPLCNPALSQHSRALTGCGACAAQASCGCRDLTEHTVGTGCLSGGARAETSSLPHALAHRHSSPANTGTL